MQIINCWVCELPNSMVLIGGENINIKNCQLGAQPTGITCKAQGGTNFRLLIIVSIDGRENLVLDGCNNCIVEGNNFKSYYNGILVLSGNDNRVNKNIFGLPELFKIRCSTMVMTLA